MQKLFRRFVKSGAFVILILLCLLLSSCVDADNPKETYREQIQIKEINVSAKAPPEVSAISAIGIESSSGEIFYSKNIDKRLPMASTTKIMTAIVAIENGNIADTVKVNRKAVGVEGSSIYLYEGESLTLENLLYALLLESANDAAVAIAIHIGGDLDSFVDMMNETADKLGLTNTHFENPHGLDSDTHYTTARELGIIATYAMKNPTFRQIVSTYKTTIPLADGEGTRVLVNHNKLLRNYDGAIGIKTGYTKRSGRCLVSASLRDGVELICVTISAPSDWQDHENILDFGNSIYEKKALTYAGEILFKLPVTNGVREEALLSVSSDVSATVQKDSEIKTVIEAPRFLFAPVKENQTVGKILFIQDGNIVAEAPLICTESIDKSNNKKSFRK